jgi:hypothetical protein
MKTSRQSPSWTAFGTVVAICCVPAAAMLVLAWFFSGMKGWSDGSGAYESHAFEESLPLLALAAIPLGYLPHCSRRVGGAFLALSLALSIALSIAYVVYIFPLIGIGNAIVSVAVVVAILWAFWSVRMSLEKKEPN